MNLLKRERSPKSSSKSSSKSTSSPTSSLKPSPQFNPTDFKFDYDYGAGEPSSSTSQYKYHTKGPGYDVPPPYYSQEASGSSGQGSSSDQKSPIEQNPFRDAASNMGKFKENPLRVLEKFDIVIVLDDSHSMLIPDRLGGRTRWDQAWDALEILVDHASRYAPNPIQIRFLNNRAADTTLGSAQDLRQLRMRTPPPTNDTYTPLGDVLDTILLAYMSETGDTPVVYSGNKMAILVITDGEASDDPVGPIVQAATFFQKNRFPLDQIGIQFVQVGDDEDAKLFLQDLDENLVADMGDHGRDIVDTIQSNGKDLDGTDLLKALTGGFNRKLDRVGEQRRR